ncbi:MAG: hypothetical protein JRJ29_14135 [Deltaproteobacteria bacterium]|nr:hypothetical protein [Deltaproteobacteria bacterium]
MVGGLDKKSRLRDKKEKEIVAFHETGHALIAESFPTTDPVNKISIIPRGISTPGYTLQLPTEERYLITRSELMDRMGEFLGEGLPKRLCSERSRRLPTMISFEPPT